MLLCDGHEQEMKIMLLCEVISYSQVNYGVVAQQVRML